MKKQLKIAVVVISDLVTDQRVHKVCTSLSNDNYEVVLIGARRKQSLKLNNRTYKATRIGLLFQKKFLFYAEFNLRAFFKLLFTHFDIVLGNDLDVMPATFLAGKIKGKPVVYDTHEYYLGMPELKGKPFIKKVWTAIEKAIFPRLNYIYTICQSFCDLYEKDYGKKLIYLLNVPFLLPAPVSDLEADRKAIDEMIPAGKHILLFQGAGINPDRGVEELVLSMQHLDAKKFHLVIVGGGDIFDIIVRLVKEANLNHCITIINKVPFQVLKHITAKAALGFTVDKSNNINHIYGLPNKIFDYLHAGVPVLSTRLPELEKIITQYNVGSFIENNEPKHIAERVTEIFSDENLLQTWRRNTVQVKRDYNWENEEVKLLQLFKKVCMDAGLQHA